MQHIIDLFEEVVGTLADVSKSEVVVGKKVELGSNKIVPLSRVSMGFGAGGGEGEGDHPHGRRDKRHDSGKGEGGGGGGGFKVRPVGIIVFSEDDVKVEGIPDKRGALDKIFEKIPDLIDKAKHRK